MMELGETSPEAHANLGRRLASCRADMIFLFGEEIRPAADALAETIRQKNGLSCRERPFLHTTDMGELSKTLDSSIKSGDLVLLKGSRGCALETLTEILTGKEGEMGVS